MVENADGGISDRRLAVRSLARLRGGTEWLLRTAREDGLNPDLREVTAASLQTIPWGDLRRQAAELFPAPPAKDDLPLPSLAQLQEKRGDAVHGEQVFRQAGTCAKCHVVKDHGDEVGPNLSEIGDKLSPQAMYESILFPSAGISHNYETYSVILNDGNVVTGIVTSQTDEARHESRIRKAWPAR